MKTFSAFERRRMIRGYYAKITDLEREAARAEETARKLRSMAEELRRETEGLEPE